MLAHLGGYVEVWGWWVGVGGRLLMVCGHSLELCWPILGGYVAPGWGLCCPISGLCSPIVRPMLAHVDLSGATGSDQGEEMRRAQNTVKRSSFRALFASGLGLVGRGLCFRLCWPILRAMWAHLGAMLAHLGGYVGPS